MMESDGLQISAYAKINLTLEVIGRRDDGFHDVATILQTVDLADRLTLWPADELAVECAVPQLRGEDNIVWSAAVQLARYAGIAPKARILIDKAIPVAAGLGGGSADAAAALRGLNRLWGLDLPRRELALIAAALGSDVPFLLAGGTALGVGRGDDIAQLPALPPVDALLVVPAETMPSKTPTLYRALTPEDFSDGGHATRLAWRTGAGTLTTAECRNAFERAAKAIFPGLAGVWEIVAATAQRPPRLSGAGPALFCLPSSESERIRVAAALRDTGATAYLVRTINPPASGGIQPTD